MSKEGQRERERENEREKIPSGLHIQHEARCGA